MSSNPNAEKGCQVASLMLCRCLTWDQICQEKNFPNFLTQLVDFSIHWLAFCFFFPARLLCDEVNFDPSLNLEYRGPIMMKGKPEPMNCWLLTRKTSTTQNSLVSRHKTTAVWSGVWCRCFVGTNFCVCCRDEMEKFSIQPSNFGTNASLGKLNLFHSIYFHCCHLFSWLMKTRIWIENKCNFS